MPTHPRLGVQASHHTPEGQERVPATVGAEPLEEAASGAHASAASPWQTVLNMLPGRAAPVEASSDSTAEQPLVSTAAPPRRAVAAATNADSAHVQVRSGSIEPEPRPSGDEIEENSGLRDAALDSNTNQDACATRCAAAAAHLVAQASWLVLESSAASLRPLFSSISSPLGRGSGSIEPERTCTWAESALVAAATALLGGAAVLTNGCSAVESLEASTGAALPGSMFSTVCQGEAADACAPEAASSSGSAPTVAGTRS